MVSKEVFESIMRMYASSDSCRPNIGSPWITRHGTVIATDGRIAISHLVPPDGVSFDRRDENDSIDYKVSGWVWNDMEDAMCRRRVKLPIDFSLLGRAASAALDDARAHAPKECYDDNDCDDCDDYGDPLTPDEYAATHACVILPGERREVVSAKYAALIADTAAAFGRCAAYGWPRKIPNRRSIQEMRILFVGDNYVILLMPLRIDGDFEPILIPFRSVGDAATGELVLGIGDGCRYDLDTLRFGNSEVKREGC